MKWILCVPLWLSTLPVFAQYGPAGRAVYLKAAPLGAAVGNLPLHAEYNLAGRHSFTAKFGVPIPARQTVRYDDRKMTFNMKATSAFAGFRSYVFNNFPQGLYVEPFVQYISHDGHGAGEGNLLNNRVLYDFRNRYRSAAVGAQLGVQFFIGGRAVLDLFFLGPQLVSASNDFQAQEVIANYEAWNAEQAADAERDIRDFTNKFPFIRGRSEITVDAETRKVAAAFSGTLPGVRMGFSVGIVL